MSFQIFISRALLGLCFLLVSFGSVSAYILRLEKFDSGVCYDYYQFGVYSEKTLERNATLYVAEWNGNCAYATYSVVDEHNLEGLFNHITTLPDYSTQKLEGLDSQQADSLRTEYNIPLENTDTLKSTAPSFYPISASAYPSPTKSTLKVDLNWKVAGMFELNNEQTLSVELISNAGGGSYILQQETAVTQLPQNREYDVSEIPSGNYTLRAQLGVLEVTQGVVIE